MTEPRVYVCTQKQLVAILRQMIFDESSIGTIIRTVFSGNPNRLNALLVKENLTWSITRMDHRGIDDPEKTLSRHFIIRRSHSDIHRISLDFNGAGINRMVYVVVAITSSESQNNSDNDGLAHDMDLAWYNAPDHPVDIDPHLRALMSKYID